MVIIPDDVLLLIFETCVHELQISPVRLLPVSRRWYALACSTPTLWTRVYIDINSFDIIPHIIQISCIDNENTDQAQRGSLRWYLDRSCSHDGMVQLPLDITIKWSTDKFPLDTHTLEEKIFGNLTIEEEMRWDHANLTETLLLALSGAYLGDWCPNLWYRLDQVQPEIDHFHDLTTETIIQTPSFMVFYRNEVHRWRSLTIDFSQFDRGGIIRCPIRSHLGMLETLTLRNTHLDFSRGVTTPSLRVMNLDSSVIDFNVEVPEIDTVKSLQLCAPEVDDYNLTHLPRINYKSLSNLELIGGCGLGGRGEHILRELQQTFNESNRLKCLTATFLSEFPNVSFLLEVPNFRVETLKLSSEYLDPILISKDMARRPSIPRMLLRFFLRDMKSIGTKVEAIDATMEGVLEAAYWLE